MYQSYFASEAPTVEPRGKHLVIKPAGGTHEVVVTPETAQQFMANCEAALTELQLTSLPRGSVVPFRRDKGG